LRIKLKQVQFMFLRLTQGDSMNNGNPFQMSGSWFKGALHAHTTRSDGKLSPEESIAFHREHGYHFLAVTDHDVITDLSALSDENFLNIPGVEVSHGRNPVGQSYHVVLVGIRRLVRASYGMTMQEAIDRWAENATLLFLAHPYWSGMTPTEMEPLENLAGLEIFNTSSQTDLGKGLATVHWDSLLARHKRWSGFAVDDTHGINDDAAGGWVWVKSARLDEQSILQALNSGAFYSSSGPTIQDFRIEEKVATVRCSEVSTINLIGLTQWGFQRRAELGASITEAEYRLTGKEIYVRAECVDAQGHAAWSNPIYLE
jgi:hypothetical protein